MGARLQNNSKKGFHSLGVLISILKHVKCELVDTGRLSERTVQLLVHTIGFSDHPLVAACITCDNERETEQVSE